MNINLIFLIKQILNLFNSNELDSILDADDVARRVSPHSTKAGGIVVE